MLNIRSPLTKEQPQRNQVNQMRTYICEFYLLRNCKAQMYKWVSPLTIKGAKWQSRSNASGVIILTKSENTLVSVVHDWSATWIFVAAPWDKSPEIVRDHWVQWSTESRAMEKARQETEIRLNVRIGNFTRKCLEEQATLILKQEKFHV